MSTVRRYCGFLDVDSFANKVGVPTQTYKNYEEGVLVPATVILQFIVLTQVRVDYMLTGQMPMFDFDGVRA